MSKIISFVFWGGLIFLAVTAVNLSNQTDTSPRVEFIGVSVLASNQADYSADENVSLVPAISLAILEDKVHDLEIASSVPVITYTSLPTKKPEPSSQEDQALMAEIKRDNNQAGVPANSLEDTNDINTDSHPDKDNNNADKGGRPGININRGR